MSTVLLCFMYGCCMFHEPDSTVVVSENGECLCWFYDNEPDKLNPCMRIPERSKVYWCPDSDCCIRMTFINEKEKVSN